jgi:hypothetical protein
MPFFNEHGPECPVIFNDAVVDDGDVAAAIAVRVRVFVRGNPVRRPPRMPYSSMIFKVITDIQRTDEIGDLAFLFSDNKIPIQKGDPRGIVTRYSSLLSPLMSTSVAFLCPT